MLKLSGMPTRETNPSLPRSSAAERPHKDLISLIFRSLVNTQPLSLPSNRNLKEHFSILTFAEISSEPPAEEQMTR